MKIILKLNTAKERISELKDEYLQIIQKSVQIIKKMNRGG